MNYTLLRFKGIVLNSVLKDMSIEGSRRMLCRRSHGFIIKIKGDTEYSFGDKKTMLSEGQVLFVKKSGSYNIREITPGCSYVINFDAVKVHASWACSQIEKHIQGLDQREEKR